MLLTFLISCALAKVTGVQVEDISTTGAILIAICVIGDAILFKRGRE